MPTVEELNALAEREAFLEQLGGADLGFAWPKMPSKSRTVDLAVYASYPTIKEGSRDPKVAEYHALLKATQSLSGDRTDLSADIANKIFGSATTKATTFFQTWAKIGVDGKVGPATWQEVAYQASAVKPKGQGGAAAQGIASDIFALMGSNGTPVVPGVQLPAPTTGAPPAAQKSSWVLPAVGLGLLVVAAGVGWYFDPFDLFKREERE